ncbi:MAG TPA: cysteine peptidase family C39 domain-containing protein [Chitinophaga sp.]|uniref:cysteine peptidase family C39 domain-containing protein n=1 Tax=Chitinophaga sp. TaxID=1869181 RepID=UPI002DB7F28A|nr:cysteine peptidase family C39 domain-containing protein [Chitinophaga sp.]HEU4552696.1 cysteine peptidase family C39 domain-containing protein [Chitinophaga sp.]
MDFPIYKQLAYTDCGPTCLRMVAQHYGKTYTPQSLEQLVGLDHEGASLLHLRLAAEQMGFTTLAAAVTFEQLDQETPLPCIVLWNRNHFVVIPPQDYNSRQPGAQILLADPEKGLVKVDKATFLQGWIEEHNRGVVLMLEPGERFYR